jgi:hypothetical protein
MASSVSRKWITIRSDVEPMSETKQLHPAAAPPLTLRFDGEADERGDVPPSFAFAAFIIRSISRGWIRPLFIRNI